MANQNLINLKNQPEAAPCLGSGLSLVIKTILNNLLILCSDIGNTWLAFFSYEGNNIFRNLRNIPNNRSLYNLYKGFSYLRICFCLVCLFLSVWYLFGQCVSVWFVCICLFSICFVCLYLSIQNIFVLSISVRMVFFCLPVCVYLVSVCFVCI